nr:MAG TPA: hypothetical protein [Caudoviricetes sp.]
MFSSYPSSEILASIDINPCNVLGLDLLLISHGYPEIMPAAVTKTSLLLPINSPGLSLERFESELIMCFFRLILVILIFLLSKYSAWQGL